MPENKTFLESAKFPVHIVNEASAKEKKGGARPKYWEMVFWWTRKPLTSARAIIAGALLPEDYDLKDFIENLQLHNTYNYWCPKCLKGFNKKEKKKSCPTCGTMLIKRKKSPHNLNPKIPQEIYEKYFKEKSLLDPFAGFGSIPLEALRLGLSKVAAVELLPTAYIFLKAVLEYPLEYGNKLIEDVKRWGDWTIQQLQKDPDIKDLYDPDIAVYIGTWEIKCPHCNKWTPLIGNWWLARTKDKKGWKALAWMKPEKRNDKIEIKIVDAKKLTSGIKHFQLLKKGRKTIGIKMDDEKEYVGWEKLEGAPNIDAKQEKAWCLYCGAEIIDKIHDKEVKENVWYVKYALKTWNNLFEEYLNGRLRLEDLRNKTLARLKVLVKVKVLENDLEFKPATEEDNDKIWKALESLKQVWRDPDIPTEPIPPYENRQWMTPLYGAEKFYKLFNPRQLLILVKLIKLIRETGKKIEEEKIGKGWNKEDAFRYAEAITTYLAIAIARYVDHNNISTLLHPSNPYGIEIAHALSMRGIALQWNWGDTNPLLKTSGPLRTNSWTKCLEKELDGFKYLAFAIHSSYDSELFSYLDSSSSNNERVVRVLLDDANNLSKFSENEKFDLIVTDPPYYDDVPYSELSDFYYVWLKRALSDNDGYTLVPRFHKYAFFDEWGNEIETQWSAYARSEITLNINRFKYLGTTEEVTDKKEGKRVYAEMLGRAFESMAKRLKAGGVLVTYFAHSDPDAWKALLYAGWKKARLKVSVAYPILTESEESVVSRGKAAITASIIVVWRKITGEDILDLSTERNNILEVLSGKVREYISMGLHGITLFTAVYALALGELTRASKVIDGTKELDVEDIVLEASKFATKSIVRGANPEIVSKETVMYLVFKTVGARIDEESRKRLPSSDLLMIGYGTMNLDEALRAGIIRPVGSVSGAEVAKRKVFELLEPIEDTERAVLDILGVKGIDPGKPETIKTSIDALHVLELYADRGREELKKKYTKLSQALGWKAKEAIELAKAITVLGREDPEAIRCCRLLDQLGMSSLLKF